MDLSGVKGKVVWNYPLISDFRKGGNLTSLPLIYGGKKLTSLFFDFFYATKMFFGKVLSRGGQLFF